MAAPHFGFSAPLAPPQFRGTMRPAAGVSFDEPAADAPPTALEIEAASYDDLVRPRVFPLPKGDDDGSAN